MVSFLALLVIVLAFPGVSSRVNWNDELQATCGTNMKEVDGSYSRKVLNGTPAHPDESPWSVVIFFKDYKNHTIYTTGTLISDRHILTYDWIFLTNHTKKMSFRFDSSRIAKDSCDSRAYGDDMRVPIDLGRKVGVLAGRLHADQFTGREKLPRVKEVRILDGCKKLNTTGNRIALITLFEPITKNFPMARPICLGSSETPSQSANYTFYGFGDNTKQVKDATLRRTQISPVPCDDPSPEKFCVTSTQPLCNGDFGGAAVTTIDGAVHALGMYLEGPYECAKATRDTKYTFANLTHVAECICDQTRVCPLYVPRHTVPPNEDSTTSTIIPGTNGTPTTLSPNEDGSSTEGSGTGGTTEGESTDNTVTSGPGDSTVTPRSTIGEDSTLSTLIHEGGIDDETPTTSSPNGSSTGRPGTDGGESTGRTVTPGSGGDTTGPPLTTGGTQTTDDGTQTNKTCYVDDDDDIHIHIKLGKYRKTGNEEDIEVIRRGPNRKKLDKRAPGKS